MLPRVRAAATRRYACFLRRARRERAMAAAMIRYDEVDERHAADMPDMIFLRYVYFRFSFRFAIAARRFHAADFFSCLHAC